MCHANTGVTSGTLPAHCAGVLHNITQTHRALSKSHYESARDIGTGDMLVGKMKFLNEWHHKQLWGKSFQSSAM
jgi:hypothetical protein